ncbi:unnamed protein product [Ostreobium quekettii]|uniref:Uncharacterized protein n=1 Tax=Ostreobium quekettii TaxID=121088 RepID=A0A8S1ITB1_9CHLO|nr:unnamed protein product [Ostreobium quekettii]
MAHDAGAETEEKLEGPARKKARRVKGDEGIPGRGESTGQEPSLSRLTARQLAVARLVSSYKYEGKKVFKQLLERQEKWRSELESGGRPPIQPFVLGEQAPEETMLHSSLSNKRRHVPWKQAEREALKKSFLSFGFGRWREIDATMHAGQKSVRHGGGDMEDACWEFVSELLHHVDGKEAEYIRLQLESVKRQLPITTPGVPWTKVQSSAKIWTRRLQLLDNITLIAEQLADDEMRRFFERSLKGMSDTNLPAPWWSASADLALIAGVHKHGYGNYEAVRTDPQFAVAFWGAYLPDPPEGQDADPEGSYYTPPEEKGENWQPKQAPVQWPATDILTKRLKRVTENLIKAQQQQKDDAAIKSNRDKVEDSSTTGVWSRKEKTDMLKTLMAFGLPDPVDGGSPNGELCDHSSEEEKTAEEGAGITWEFLGRQCGLPGAQGPDCIRDICNELLDEAGSVLEEAGGLTRKAVHSENCQCVVCNNRRKSRQRKLVGRSSTVPKSEEEDGVTGAMEDSTDGAALLGDPGSAGDPDDDGAGDADEPSSDIVEDRKARHIPAMLRVLTPQTAARLKERLDMLQVLRRGLMLLNDHTLTRSLASKTQDMPSWWIAGLHDHNLVRGVLRHGMGSWLQIERDRSLPFNASAKIYGSTGQKLVIDPGKDATDEANRMAAQAGLDPCQGSGEGILPDGKVLMKRLKQITTLLKRLLKRSSGRKGTKDTGSQPLDGAPAASKSPSEHLSSPKLVDHVAQNVLKLKEAKQLGLPRPKKFKYTKNIKVDRDDSGRPILPLSLTSMLTLVELGRIEHVRVAFHSERHIYPIGFETRRTYASTVDPGGTTSYTCKIMDGGLRPLFQITADDDPELDIRNDTPSGSWVELFTLVNEVRGIKKEKVTISGTDMFGLSHPVISRLIQELPNANKCAYFIPQLSFYPPERATNDSEEPQRDSTDLEALSSQDPPFGENPARTTAMKLEMGSASIDPPPHAHPLTGMKQQLSVAMPSPRPLGDQQAGVDLGSIYEDQQRVNLRGVVVEPARPNEYRPQLLAATSPSPETSAPSQPLSLSPCYMPLSSGLSGAHLDQVLAGSHGSRLWPTQTLALIAALPQTKAPPATGAGPIPDAGAHNGNLPSFLQPQIQQPLGGTPQLQAQLSTQHIIDRSGQGSHLLAQLSALKNIPIVSGKGIKAAELGAGGLVGVRPAHQAYQSQSQPQGQHARAQPSTGFQTMHKRGPLSSLRAPAVLTSAGPVSLTLAQQQQLYSQLQSRSLAASEATQGRILHGLPITLRDPAYGMHANMPRIRFVSGGGGVPHEGDGALRPTLGGLEMGRAGCEQVIQQGGVMGSWVVAQASPMTGRVAAAAGQGALGQPREPQAGARDSTERHMGRDRAHSPHGEQHPPR